MVQGIFGVLIFTFIRSSPSLEMRNNPPPPPGKVVWEQGERDLGTGKIKGMGTRKREWAITGRRKGGDRKRGAEARRKAVVGRGNISMCETVESSRNGEKLHSIFVTKAPNNGP